jgi:hypothetical protein
VFVAEVAGRALIDGCSSRTPQIISHVSSSTRAGNARSSVKTGKPLQSCGECTKKRKKCFYGDEPTPVPRGRSRTKSPVRSRVPSKTGTSPAASGSRACRGYWISSEFPSPRHDSRSNAIFNGAYQFLFIAEFSLTITVEGHWR